MTADVIQLHEDPAVDAEHQVLGAIISAGASVLDDINLTAREFYDPRHEQLFELFQRMQAAGRPIDLTTVAEELRSHPIRGVSHTYPAELMGRTITTANADFHAQIIRKGAAIRLVQAVATRIHQLAGNHDDPATIIENARAALDAVAGSMRSGVELVSMADVVDEALRELTQPGAVMATPWPSLDFLIGGWRAGRVYVVGARPGNGKSIFGVNAAVHMTQRHGLETAISSLEMGRNEVTQRAISALAEVDFKALQGDALSDDDRRRVALARTQIAELPRCFVDDNPSIRPPDVRAHARNIARRGRLGMVVVDYLQLMESAAASENRQQEVARFSRQMKLIARDLNVPVIVLSQLNRGGEHRPTGLPRLADLRDSGAVEQDADVVILLHRDEDEDPTSLTLTIAKNRQGPKGTTTLQWEGEYMRLTEKKWRPGL